MPKKAVGRKRKVNGLPKRPRRISTKQFGDSIVPVLNFELLHRELFEQVLQESDQADVLAAVALGIASSAKTADIAEFYPLTVRAANALLVEVRSHWIVDEEVKELIRDLEKFVEEK